MIFKYIHNTYLQWLCLALGVIVSYSDYDANIPIKTDQLQVLLSRMKKRLLTKSRDDKLIQNDATF